MKFADSLADHPKFIAAAELIGGPTARAEVLALFVAAVGYSCQFLTDGFVSDAWVRGVQRMTPRGQKVAAGLSADSIRLWHRVKGGYRIHDFHDWNKPAKEIKENREAERQRSAANRQAKTNGGGTHART